MKIESISFVIPAYNEETQIERTVLDAYDAGKKLRREFEILVVDDASTDRTAQILKSLRLLKYLKPYLRVITHPTNRGCGASLKNLYINAKYDLIYYIPADRQIRASEIAKFLPRIDTHHMVLAHRHRRNDPLHRIILSKMYHVMVWSILGLPFPDVEGNVLFRRELIEKIPLKSSGVFAHTELIYKTYKSGYPVTSVKIDHFPRQGKKTRKAFVRDAFLAAYEFGKNAVRMRMGRY